MEKELEERRCKDSTAKARQKEIWRKYLGTCLLVLFSKAEKKQQDSKESRFLSIISKCTYLFPYILCLVYEGRHGCSSQAMKPGTCLYISHSLRLLTPNITCRTSGGSDIE